MWELLITFGFLLVNGVDPMAIDGNNERNNYFNIELLQAVNEQQLSNVIISPLSVKIALTILAEGTGGRTREELLTTLRLPYDVTKIRAISKQTLQPLTSLRKGSEIDLANRLWISQQAAAYSNEYNDVLKCYYGGDTKSIDFNDVMSASSLINQWVRQVTRNHISNIVDPGSLSADTQVLLTSALYFKGKWADSFDGKLTREQCFNVPDVGCQSVPMMENLAYYRYANLPTLKAEVVEIPYSDGRLSMLIMLPNNRGLQALHILSKDLSYTPISTIVTSLHDEELLLHLPRFNIESKIDLLPALESMGIRDLFNVNANLSGIIADGGARVGSVLHNAKIEVNEEGTVAAAVTAFAVVPLMGATYEVLQVDRPFLFAVIDRTNSNMIFAGRIIQPQTS